MTAKLRRLRRKSFFYKRKSIYGLGAKTPVFHFGNAAFQPTSLVVLTSRFITRFILFLKKIVRKRDKSQRRYWLAPRSFLRVTLKSKGARMGKGKGKHVVLIQRFQPFINFIEFAGVRTGRLRRYLYKLNTRMSSRFILRIPTYSILERRLPFFR